MNRIVILIIMSTFFMEGCVSNNKEAINYFDTVYIPIQEVVELDNLFQEQIHNQLVATDEVSDQDDILLDDEAYLKSITQINAAHQSLKNYLDDALIKLKEVEVFNNETEFQRAGIALLSAYSKVASEDFEEMIEIIQKEDLSEADNNRFNQLLKQSSNVLNLELEDFYEVALDYGDRYEIDLEFDED